MNSGDNRSAWPLVCALGSYLCLFLAWLAKGMVVGSDAAQNNTGGVIGPSFFSSMGILLFCVPVVLVGVVLSLAGLIKGYRIPSAAALVLYFLLGKSLFHAPNEAEELGRQKAMAHYVPPSAPEPPLPLPEPAKYLRPHANVEGLALAGNQVVTIGFTPPPSPKERGDSIRFWNLDGTLAVSAPKPIGSTVQLLRGGQAYVEIASESESYVYQFASGEHAGPFQRPPDYTDRVLGVLSNRWVIRLSQDGSRVQFWDLNAGSESARFTSQGGVVCHALTRNNHKLAYVSRHEGVLNVVDCITQKASALPFERFDVMDVQFSEDGQSVVLVGGAPKPPPRPRQRGEVIVSHGVTVGGRYFPAGTQLAVFDLAHQTNVSFVLPELKYSSRAAFLSADRQRVTLASPEAFSIVDLRKPPGDVRKNRGHVRTCVSSDGRLVATYGSYPHHVQFWNGETGEKLTRKLLHSFHSPVAHHMEFAGDNETVVVMRGGMVELCGPQTGSESILLIDRAYTNAVLAKAVR